MSDIPDAIMQAAKDAHAQFADSRVKDNLTVIIARALMAERKKALEEAATALVEMAQMTALAAKYADNAIGRSAGQFGAEVLRGAAAEIRKLGTL